MQIYCLKTCDTCRKAIAALRAAGHDPVVTDLRADGMPEPVLAQLLAEFGDSLLNRSSTTWRKLSEDEQIRDPAALLREHPTLMKRPIIEMNGTYRLGWKADVQAALLG